MIFVFNASLMHFDKSIKNTSVRILLKKMHAIIITIIILIEYICKYIIIICMQLNLIFGHSFYCQLYLMQLNFMQLDFMQIPIFGPGRCWLESNTCSTARNNNSIYFIQFAVWYWIRLSSFRFQSLRNWNDVSCCAGEN